VLKKAKPKISDRLHTVCRKVMLWRKSIEERRRVRTIK
jgi:hypothetical protein